MLPDFRVVTIAVISTFLFAVSVGFYTSSRLASERKPRPESLAAIEENPLNRIALNWPEPVQQTQNPLDLDFAVTAKVLRNPVRDVTEEPASAPEQKVAAAPPPSNPNVVVERPAVDLPKIETPKPEAPKPEVSKPEAPKPEIAQIETPRVDTVTAPATPQAPVAPQAKPEEELPTASIVERSLNPNPPSEEPKRAPEPALEPPPAQIASRPDPDSEEARPEIENAAAPAIKPSAAKPAAKKTAKRKAKKAKVVRPRPRPITTATTNSFFPFFGFRQ